MLVEIWWSERLRTDGVYHDTRAIDLVTAERPRKLDAFWLDVETRLVVGRPDPELTLPPKALRWELPTTESAVSRRAVEVFHDGRSWVIDSGQQRGVAVQEWGSHGGDVVLERRVGTMPTSVRIDGRAHFFWVLVHPDPDDEPTESGPARATDDADMTDPLPSGRFQTGSEEHRALGEAAPALRGYYGQFLEWPPRPRPQVDATLPPEYDKKSSFERVVRNVRVHAVRYGYAAEQVYAREVELITWLTSTGNLSFEEFRLDSRLGSPPEQPTPGSGAQRPGVGR